MTRRLQLLLVLVVGAVFVGGVRMVLQAVYGPRVPAVHAVRQPLTQTLLLTGRIEAPGRADLGTTLQGTVSEVLVEEGAVVEAGTVLLRLAREEQQARVAEAEAAVQEARARVRRVQGVGRSVARERLEQAQLELNEATRELARQETMRAVGGVSEAALEDARLRVDTARSQLHAAEQELAATSRGGADTSAAVAVLARAEASLEVARVALERTELRAPTGGRILDRSVEPGQVVRPGDPLFAFSGSGPLEARITPDEVHLGRLQVGQEAAVVVQAFPGRPLAATVARLAPSVDPDRGTVEVWLRLDGPVPDWVRPDMTATVEVVLGSVADALVLPVELVQDRDSAHPWVLTVVDGTASKSTVTVGLEGTSTVELLDGIDDSTVILDASSAPSHGEPVRVMTVVPALEAR